MNEINLISQTFDREVLQSKIPVLIDFWASWCGPCMMLSPVIAEIAQEWEGKCKVCKVNVDEQMELAAKFGIESIPTLVVFDKGQLKAKSLGYLPKAEVEAFLQNAISK